jgi:hypothetical protein
MAGKEHQGNKHQGIKHHDKEFQRTKAGNTEYHGIGWQGMERTRPHQDSMNSTVLSVHSSLLYLVVIFMALRSLFPNTGTVSVRIPPSVSVSTARTARTPAAVQVALVQRRQTFDDI